MLVCIDRQHSGKPNRLSDRGASQDLDGDGVISWAEKEAIWTGRIAIELEILLLEMGYDVLPISDGDYKSRHERVNQYSQGHLDCIYLALHLNAGGGDYGSFFHHYASVAGRELAQSIADSLHQSLPNINSCKAIAARSEDWTKNAWNTIKGVGRPVAICCEPLFMDTHQNLLNHHGIKQISLGIAQGIKNWVEQ